MTGKKIVVFDYEKKRFFEEKVFGERILFYLYEKNSIMRNLCRASVCKFPFLSRAVGLWYKQFFTSRNVAPFIEQYGIDASEFETNEFTSFNDFFIRKLKKEARPIHHSDVVIPADGRYLAFQNFRKGERLYVKGEKFSLAALLGSEALAKKYENGAIVIARLAPPDYHRFHFPLDCTPSKPLLINGPLFSVNPIALRKNIHYITQNKRSLTELKTPSHGTVLCVAVGATSVGSIHYSFTPDVPHKKGDEMGYFSFGGSMVIYLFEPGKITLKTDLTSYSNQGIEVLSKMGQSLID